MPKNDIGGFFLSLGLNLDRQSFDTGNKLIDNVGNSFNKLIGSARNAAVVMATTAIATGAVESTAYKTAAKLNITTEALDTWKATAKIAGVETNALVSSISKIANVQARIKYDKSGLAQLQTQLDKIQMSYAEIQNLDAGQATAAIINKAQSLLNGENLDEIAAYLSDILGSGASDLLIELDRRNMTLSQFQADAQKTVFTTAEDNQTGADFAAEINTLKAEMESIGKLTGDTIAGVLTPYVSDLNSYIQKNKEEIQAVIKTVGEVTDKIIGTGIGLISNWWEAHGDELLALLQTIGTITVGIAEKMKVFKDSKAGQAMATYANTLTSNTIDSLSNFGNVANNGGDLGGAFLDFLNDVIYAPVRAARDKLYGGAQSEPKAPEPTPIEPDWWVNDGIMRPDGTVTQVAPDDWVLAARDLGDLSKAFMPKQTPAIEQSIVIDQTQKMPNFTVTKNEPNPAIVIDQTQKMPNLSITKNEPNPAVYMSETIADLAATVGDLARSFVPQTANNVQNSSEYVINQTFNISGSNDMPQMLRQEAYRGTQDGLLEMMNQGSRRLQLMSGLR